MTLLLQLIFWGALLAVALSIGVLLLAVASRLSRRPATTPYRPRPRPRSDALSESSSVPEFGAVPKFAAVTKLWPLAAATVVLASLMVVAAFAVSSSTLVANINPATCSADGAQPASLAPKALVAADDYLAQGAYDFDRGNCDAAIADFGRAIALNPNLAEAYNSRAYTYMVKQQYALALPDLDRALQIRPNYLNALMNRADIHNYYYDIDYNLAIADYDRVLRLPGSEHISVCGHRMLAANHGWNAGVLADILTGFKFGAEPGCGAPTPGL